jgi:YfiH family protein
MLTLSDDHFYRVPKWTKYQWLDHGFGTKKATPPDDLAMVKQVHSGDVLIARHLGLNGTGDALISEIDGIVAGVRTADCLPILLVDPVTRTVGTVHAGWRGTAQDIAVRAARMMCERFGSKVETMEAAIGPGIGLCCFEVGPEVAREFGPYESTEKTKLDLVRVNREKLKAMGIQKIYEADTCTYCGDQNFYSFRREGEAAGRMFSYAGIRKGQALRPAPPNFD